MAIKSTPLAFARFEETLEGDEVTTGGWPLRADSPELAALREMQAQHRLANRLSEIATRRAKSEHGHRSATPERRAERRAQKEARRRKKTDRKRGRR